jgi:hypothetical protein
LDEHLIVPARALPVDHHKMLAEKRAGWVSDRDRIAGSVERQGTPGGWFVEEPKHSSAPRLLVKAKLLRR